MSDEEEAVRRRTAAVADYRKKLLQHKELESRVRTGDFHLSNLYFTRKGFDWGFFFCRDSLNYISVVKGVLSRLV